MSKLYRLSTANIVAMVSILMIFITTAPAHGEKWSFGVIADTQWTMPDDGRNPNSVAVDIINQVNQEFINKGVKFVVAVGDITDNGNNLALDTRATYAQALYNAGIGFFPLRGNHESSQTAALEFVRIFPQTQNGLNNATPSDALVTTDDDANTHPVPPIGTPFTVGSNFSSPSDNLEGLSYSFDYENARFVLLDQFTRRDGTGSTNTNIIDQQDWINNTLVGKPASGHAFVFSHKNLIGENHTDTLFGKDPGQNIDAQNAFIGSLYNNGVHYCISGHDHIHQRSIIASPDVTSQVQEIICGSDSSKFYIPLGNAELPGTVSNDVQFDNPPRETSISQERNSIGYYIYTVDGLQVTVDYYSARAYPALNVDEYLIATTPALSFLKRETFGYSLNGKEFLVPQGQTYTNVQDSFSKTTAQILSGINGSMATDGSGRHLTNEISTGWTQKNKDTISDILTLSGMANSMGSAETDVYTLSMTYKVKGLNIVGLKKGKVGLAVRDDNGNWINAVDKNFGGMKNFVMGAWNASYKLGTYGFDADENTVWAVINYNGDFVVNTFKR